MKTSEKYEEENTEVTLKLTSAASSLPLIFINILRQAHNIVTVFVWRNSVLAILRGMMLWFWCNLASGICNSLFQHIVYIAIHGKVKSAWSRSDSWHLGTWWAACNNTSSYGGNSLFLFPFALFPPPLNCAKHSNYHIPLNNSPPSINCIPQTEIFKIIASLK